MSFCPSLGGFYFVRMSPVCGLDLSASCICLLRVGVPICVTFSCAMFDGEVCTGDCLKCVGVVVWFVVGLWVRVLALSWLAVFLTNPCWFNSSKTVSTSPPRGNLG